MRTSSLVLFLTLSASLSQAASFTNGQAARAVIGQAVFTDGAVAPVVNTVQTASQGLLGGASGLAFYGGLLFVADDNRLGATPSNNRVVAFDTSQIAGLYSDPSNATHPSTRCYLCGFNAVGVIGQADFTSNLAGRGSAPTTTAGSLNRPVAVATDGHHLAIADSDNNRILLWNTLPPSGSTPADVVLGQANFSAFATPQVVNASSVRGPQGVWFQNGKLFVADTQNFRILIWNTVPTQNNQPADIALGQPNLNSANHPPTTTVNPATNSSSLLNPVSVSSDGTHLFVSDLGYNRVLIWNSIPTSSGQAADVVVGQPDMTTAVANFSSALCGDTTTDANLRYNPCAKTLSFPRYALAGGGKLFIADAGNDRVLIYNSIPTVNGTAADVVLGQQDFTHDVVTNTPASVASTVIDNTSSVDTLQSPTSLAYDGVNLYVADPFNDRVLQFTPADIPLPNNSVVNWASEIIRQEGVVTFTGTVVAADIATVTVAGTAYTYTLVTGDTYDKIAKGIVNAINSSNSSAGDPNVTAIFGGTGTGSVYLSSKASNLNFDAISLSATTSNTANLTATSSGGYLTAGTAATGAPGMLVEINAPAGFTFTDQTAVTPLPLAPTNLPTTVAGVQVIVDGVPAPIFSVSPSQIIFQLAYMLYDRTSASVYVRSTASNGNTAASNIATTATPVYIAPANPGLFNAPAFPGQTRPWPALGALHQLGNPNATVSIDGTAKAADTATITIQGVAYTYTVVAGDSLASITQNLVNLINSPGDPNVVASVGAAFTRVVLTARQPGAAGTGITIAGSTSASASVTVTAYTSATCCNVPQGTALSTASPAVPGETIVLLASGLGALSGYAQAGAGLGGQAFIGIVPNTAVESVSATMNGVTAQIVSAGLPLYSYGIYQVQLIVPSSLTANSTTQVYIAQNAFISNTVTVPIANAGTVVTAPVAPVAPGSGIPGVGQQVLVSPASLVFVKQSSYNVPFGSQTVTVQNVGTSGLNIASTSITGANAADFAVTPTCPSSLSPSASCTLNVSYTGLSAGVETASLVITDSGSSSVQTVLLTGISTTGSSIMNLQTGKALDVTNGSLADTAPIQQWEITSAANQRWTLIPVGTAYAIMNLASGKVLDVTGASLANGAPVQQYTYLGGPNQLWNLSPVGNGYFSIINLLSGKALDVTGALFENGTPVQQYTFFGAPNQLWKFSAFQSFSIQSVGTGSVLDVPGGDGDNGVLIQEWQANGFPQQQWLILPVDATYFRIVNVYTQKCLDVVGSSNANATLIQQYEYGGGANQLWSFVPTGNGSFAIVNKQSGRALDIIGGSAANGTQIQQFDYLGDPQQQWKLVPGGIRGL